MNIVNLIEKIQSIKKYEVKEASDIKILIFNENRIEFYITKQHILSVFENHELVFLLKKLLKDLNYESNLFLIGFTNIMELFLDFIKFRKPSIEFIMSCLPEINTQFKNIPKYQHIDYKNNAMITSIKFYKRCINYIDEYFGTNERIQTVYFQFIDISEFIITMIKSTNYTSYCTNKMLDFLKIFLSCKSFLLKKKLSVIIIKEIYDLLFIKSVTNKTKCNLKFTNIDYFRSKQINKLNKMHNKKLKLKKNTINKKKNNSSIKVFKPENLHFLLAHPLEHFFIGIGNQNKPYLAKNNLLKRISLQKYVLLIINSLHILLTDHSLLDFEIDTSKVLHSFERFLQSIDCKLDNEIFLNYTLESNEVFKADLNKIILLFASQDDYLIEILLLLIKIQNWIPTNSLFNSNIIFIDFLILINFDCSIMIDFLTSPETNFLTYFLLQLKYINSQPNIFKTLFVEDRLKEQITDELTYANDIPNTLIAAYTDSKKEDSHFSCDSINKIEFYHKLTKFQEIKTTTKKKKVPTATVR